MGEKLLLFGPPGVGKGTQAIRLSAALRVPHISTGDILRASLQSHTPLGSQVRRYVESGELVPDETIVDVVRERLDRRDARDGFVLDGFPRTVSQAVALAKILGGIPPALDSVVVLHAPTEALVERLSGRRICESCQTSYHLSSRPPKHTGTCDRCGGVLIQRADDVEETVRFRQNDYAQKTQPVIDYFTVSGWPVRTVDAIGDIDQVFGRVYTAVFWG
ncbi:MAG: adenylate kinase [Deltaproteobacteria bacterium]|nr:adenylate kinase [Deltaproteobacteria bacterium]